LNPCYFAPFVTTTQKNGQRQEVIDSPDWRKLIGVSLPVGGGPTAMSMAKISLSGITQAARSFSDFLWNAIVFKAQADR